MAEVGNLQARLTADVSDFVRNFRVAEQQSATSVAVIRGNVDQLRAAAAIGEGLQDIGRGLADIQQPAEVSGAAVRRFGSALGTVISTGRTSTTTLVSLGDALLTLSPKAAGAVSAIGAIAVAAVAANRRLNEMREASGGVGRAIERDFDKTRDATERLRKTAEDIQFEADVSGLDEIEQAVARVRREFEGFVPAGTLKRFLDQVREAKIDEVLRRTGNEAGNAGKLIEDLYAKLAKPPATLDSLPEQIRNLIPEDLQLEIDTQIFARQIEEARTALEANLPPDLFRKVIEAFPDPDNLEEVRAAFRDLTKTERKVIEVEFRDVSRGRGGGALPADALRAGVSTNLIDFSTGISQQDAIAGGFSSNVIDFNLAPKVVESPGVPLREWLAAQPARFERALGDLPLSFGSQIESEIERLRELMGSQILLGPGLQQQFFNPTPGPTAQTGTRPFGLVSGFTELGRRQRDEIASVRSAAVQLQNLETAMALWAQMARSLAAIESSNERTGAATDQLARHFRAAGFISTIERTTRRATGDRSFRLGG